MSYADLLTRIPLFAGLAAVVVDRLQGLTMEAGFPAGPEVVRAVGNRIRATIAESRPPVGAALKLTVSGGYATCPDHGRDPHSLVRLADQALLRAKDQGRNCIADPEIPDEPPPSGG